MVSCYAEESPTFQPSLRVVVAITQTNPAQITTSFDHDYESGLLVSFRIPKRFGMVQMNNLVGEITVTGPTTFEVAIDATEFDAFALPVAQRQCAQVVPFGSINSTIDLATKNVL